MGKVAYDIMPELLDLAKMIDYSKIVPAEQKQLLSKLDNAAAQYLKPRNIKPVMKEINIEGCPQALLDILSKYDTKPYETTFKRVALKITMTNWLKANIPVKKGK